MRIFKLLASALIVTLMLTGCATQNRNTYRHDEVGKSSAVSFGTVASVRPVDIIGENTGAGAGLGAVAGAGIGSQCGQGSGNAWAVVGGLVAGAIIDTASEHAMSDRTGIEYIVTLEFRHHPDHGAGSAAG